MRSTSLVTISLPKALRAETEKLAKRQSMTRSELLRVAIRAYIEETKTKKRLQISREEKLALKAITSFETERKQGKLKILRGSLVDLMK